MRKPSWTMVVVVLCVLGVLLYYMKNCEVCRQTSNNVDATAEVKTSMDIDDEPEELEGYAEEGEDLDFPGSAQEPEAA